MKAILLRGFFFTEELIDAVSASAVEVGTDDDALELEETTLKPR